MQQYLQHTETIQNNLIQIVNMNISNTETRKQLINTLYDFFEYTNLYIPQIQSHVEKVYIIKIILTINKIKIQEKDQDLLIRLKIIYIQINLLFYIYYKNLFESQYLNQHNTDEESGVNHINIFGKNTANNRVIFEDIVSNINDFFNKPKEQIHENIANHHNIYRNILYLLRNTEVPYYHQVTDILHENMFKKINN